MIKSKNFDSIIGKVLYLTKQIYLKEPQDDSRSSEKFMATKRGMHPLLGSSFGMEWWITSVAFESRKELAKMAIKFDSELQGGDKDSFTKIIREALQESVIDAGLFCFESCFSDRTKTFFDARAIKDPREFGERLWSKIRANMIDSLVTWLVMYPVRLIKTDSFILGYDGLTFLKSNDQIQWEKITQNYENAQFWNPVTGDWIDEVDNRTFNDFVLNPTWLVCEALGTASSSLELAVENMRTLVAILLSSLNNKIPYILTKSGAEPASALIQFPHDATKAACGAKYGKTTVLFPPLLHGVLDISSDVLSEVQDWYAARATALEPAAQRATTAAHFIHYGIIHDGLERYIHFYIALDALFGERFNVDKNIKEGIKKTFPGQARWEEKADEFFDLRNEIVHGGTSNIKKWDRLDHYEQYFKSDPLIDIQTAAMTALKDYFTNRIYEHLFSRIDP